MSRRLFLGVFAMLLSASTRAAEPAALKWSQLPPLPDREGFAGCFAGASGGALVVAGGANFPDKRPWDGGTKTWYDAAFVLDSAKGPWKTGSRLPRPAAYGVSLTTPEGVLCIGGGDANRHFSDAYTLRWDGQRLSAFPAPPLPKPCAFMSGAVVGDAVYVAGGIETPPATTCLDTFWSLDLRADPRRWTQLPPCPGGPRMLAAAGAADGAFYLFSGTSLSPDADGKPVRQYLRDAWRYTPAAGWTRLPDLPRPAVAAPSPVPLLNGRLLVISGDDGTRVGFKPEPQHPGFPRTVLAYDPAAHAWSEIECPISRATAPTAAWKDQSIIPSGEARPGYRSPEVWSVQPAARP